MDSRRIYESWSFDLSNRQNNSIIEFVTRVPRSKWSEARLNKNNIHEKHYVSRHHMYTYFYKKHFNVAQTGGNGRNNRWDFLHFFLHFMHLKDAKSLIPPRFSEFKRLLYKKKHIKRYVKSKRCNVYFFYNLWYFCIFVEILGSLIRPNVSTARYSDNVETLAVS